MGGWEMAKVAATDTGTPLRITFYFARGDEREFAHHLDAAKTNIERAVMWRPSPVNPTILDRLADR
jgi:hypothetical protein